MGAEAHGKGLDNTYILRPHPTTIGISCAHGLDKLVFPCNRRPATLLFHLSKESYNCSVVAELENTMSLSMVTEGHLGLPFSTALFTKLPPPPPPDVCLD